MTRHRTLLLALALSLVAWIAYRDVVSEDPNAGWDAVFVEPQPTLAANDIERLLDLEPKTVVAVSLEYKGVTAQSQRTAYGWTNTAGPRAINDFLDSLSELAIILTVSGDPATEDLAGYGLVEPLATITLDRDRLAPVSIALGHRNPSATAIYAQTNQRPGVVLTGAVVLWDLQEVLTALSESTHDPIP